MMHIKLNLVMTPYHVVRLLLSIGSLFPIQVHHHAQYQILSDTLCYDLMRELIY